MKNWKQMHHLHDNWVQEYISFEIPHKEALKVNYNAMSGNHMGDYLRESTAHQQNKVFPALPFLFFILER